MRGTLFIAAVWGMNVVGSLPGGRHEESVNGTRIGRFRLARHRGNPGVRPGAVQESHKSFGSSRKQRSRGIGARSEGRESVFELPKIGPAIHPFELSSLI
jgi:hypothetical protein